MALLAAGSCTCTFSSSLSPFLPVTFLCPCLLCSFPVLSCPASASPTFCVPHPFTPACQPCLQLLIWGRPQEAGGRRDAQLALAVPLPCGRGRKGGQRAEGGGRSGPTWSWGPALVGKERRKQGTWGQRVWGCQGGQRLPRSCKPEPLPALWAELRLRLDFARRRRAGIRLQVWAADDKEPQ